MKNTKLFKKIFITGGAGYVGSALVPMLLKNNYEVVVYDLYIYGDVFSEYKNNSNLVEIKGDIRNKEDVIKASKGCDAIIHLACISNDPSCDLNPKLSRSINYDAFFNLKRPVIKRWLQVKRKNGFGRLLIKIKEKNITEDSTLEPLTDYSKYKANCEDILLNLKNPGFEYVILRPATICGYSPRLRLDVVVNILTINAIVNKKIKIFGGSQLRPNINIKDMVRAYELMLEAPKEKIDKQIFNVGYQNHTVKEIAEIIKNVCNDPKIVFEEIPTDDNRSYHINSDKIKKVLGFVNKFTIEDAVQSLIDVYKTNLIKNPMENPLYYNIKRMKELNLD